MTARRCRVARALWNASWQDDVRFPIASKRLGKGFLIASLASGLFLGAASLQAQPLGAVRLAPDLDQTIECRRLLLEDPILGPLNLGVRVRDRVAVLWGPAPSREISRRAEQCLRTMIELTDVQNQMHLAPDMDWGFPNGLPGLPQFLPNRAPLNLPGPVAPPLAPGERKAAEVARHETASDGG